MKLLYKTGKRRFTIKHAQPHGCVSKKQDACTEERVGGARGWLVASLVTLHPLRPRLVTAGENVRLSVILLLGQYCLFMSTT